MHFKTSPHTSLDHVKCTRAHTHTDSCKHIHTVYAHTHRTQLQRIVGAEKSRGLMGSYGRWQNVLHAQTNGVWQLPLRKTCGCFLFFPLFLFFITAWLTASPFLFTSVLHFRWQAIRGEPLPFHSLPLFFLSFILSVSFLSFLLRSFSSLFLFFPIAINEF